MASLEISEDIDLTNLDNKQKLILLDKVFFKILASETDYDFEENLAKYLPNLLLKLTLNEEIVRKKVMEILVHVNKRIKSRPSVKLPLDVLLARFNDPALMSSTFFCNFCLIYIKLAFPRLDASEKAIMIEKLLKTLEGKPLTQQDSLTSLIIDGIRHLELKPNENSNIEKYSIKSSTSLRKYFLDYLFHVLLLPYSLTPPASKPATTSTTNPTPNQTTAAPEPAPQPTTTTTTATPINDETPACMSESIFKRLKANLPLDNGDEIEQLKIGILRFLSVNVYEPHEVLFHFIVATSDTRYSVVQVGELHVKRIVGACDLNDAAIVNKFFHIFLGDKITVQKSSSDLNKIEASNTRIRLKLFPYLLRSRAASSSVAQAIQLVFDCLFGSAQSTNQKIKLYAIQFVHLMALNSESDKLAKIGSVLIQGLNKLIAESKDDTKLRGLSYVAIGKIIHKIPNILSNDINLVHNFFSALESEDSDTKISVQEALVLMIDSLRGSKKEDKEILLSLLFQYVENDVSQCRSMAVKYAFEVFDQDQLESRYLLLLATSDSKEEIRQEASKYLHRTHDSEGNELKMASFEEWVDFMSSKIEDRLIRKYKLYTFGTHTLAFDLTCYQEILIILRLALAKSAQIASVLSIDAKSIDAWRDQAPMLVKYARDELAERNIGCLFKYVNIVKDYCLAVANPIGIYLLLEICSISSPKVARLLHENIDWFKNQSFSVNEQVRIFSAELWSLILINYISERKSFESFFDSLIHMNKSILENSSRSFETRHGAILCIGYALGKLLDQKQPFDDSVKTNIKTLISSICSFLSDANLSQAAIVSLGEIARNGSLIFENRTDLLSVIECLQKKLLTSQETTKLKEKVAATLGYMCLHPVVFISQGEKDESELNLNKLVMQKLLDSSQAKQIELHMAIGEALVNCALADRSDSLINPWLTEYESANRMEIDEKSSGSDDENLTWLVDQLLNTYMANPNQHLRQAACFWLLVVVKKATKKSELFSSKTTYLYRVQDAFIQRLGESDEVTQDVASKAIGVIFDMANDEQKKVLVARLTEIITGGGGASGSSKGKKPVGGTVTSSAESGLKILSENEEVFQPNQIEGNITTYKELCSLASDLNKPDLVYQFMNLAHHNSLWNTRRGAAFGFSAITQLASDQLRPYLPTIVPKLFRYQFDPSAKIQQSMCSILDQLIKKDKKIIDAYLNDILGDLEAHMLDPLWRVRESCCLALCDLLKGGRNLEDISARFGTFWSLLFKLADDIKESVRAAAQMALKSMQRVTVAYSTSVSNVDVCRQTIACCLPILIQSGLQSTLAEIQALTVMTVRDLAKNATKAILNPYLTDLIVSLLETLSGFEPPDLNYISLKLASQEAQEKLDAARIAASKSTPMVETITMCIEYIDEEETLAQLIPRVIEIIRTSLGVTTKAGACNLISALVDREPTKMSPYSGKLMAALVNSMSTEHNKTINKYYCGVLGTISKVAKESSIENLINRLQQWYFEKDDDGLKLSCGLTLMAISQNNSELMAKFSKKCIPLAFFAIHQQSGETLSTQQQQQQQQQQKTTVWNDVFDEITSGAEYAIRSNLAEILELLRMALEHQSWKMRIQAAYAICTVVTKLQSQIDGDSLDLLLKMLIASLTSRTWSGKDKLLMAVSSIFINCKLKLNIENPLVTEIITSMFKEANKQTSDMAYRTSSLRCLTDLVHFSSYQFKDSVFEDYWTGFVLKYFSADLESIEAREKRHVEMLRAKFEEKDESTEESKEAAAVKASGEGDRETTEEKSEEDKENEKVNSSLKLIVLETIGKCFSYSTEIQEKYILQMCLLISDSLSKITWQNQLLLIKSLDIIFDKWSIELNEQNFDSSLRSLDISGLTVVNCIAKSNISNLKREGISVLDKIINIIIKEKENETNWKKLTISGNENDEIKYKVRGYIISNLMDSFRVLLEEMSLKETSGDLKEKPKSLSKLLYAKFTF